MDVEKGLVAVVGVSANEEKFGFKIFRDLLAAGYEVEGVNPAGGNVKGRPVYKTLADIGRPIHTVITVVPPRVTEAVARDCVALKVGQVWMQPGSESESAVEELRRAGVPVIKNACFMVRKGVW